MTKSQNDTSGRPEFSYFISCEKKIVGGKSFQIEANPDERTALAKRLSVDKLDVLKAEFSVVSGVGGLFSLTGRIKARIRQSCVVSLKPVVSNIETSFERTYSPASQSSEEQEKDPGEGCPADGAELAVNLPDPPDLLENGGIDLGEVAAQELAVEIDPFPRLADAEFRFETDIAEQQQYEAAKNPFAVLEKLKKKLE